MSDQPMRAELVWNDGLRFTAIAGGHELVLDGGRHEGSTPMEMLLEALAGCMAIDLVHILGRMSAELKSLRAQVEGVRAESHPRRFTALNLHFDIVGKDIRAEDVERAIKLSRETYCSVFACFRPDTEVKVTYSLAT